MLCPFTAGRCPYRLRVPCCLLRQPSKAVLGYALGREILDHQAATARGGLVLYPS
jgi:hypothetical protein